MVALIRVWEVLNCPGGQGLEPLLKEADIIEKLRQWRELGYSDEVVKKLKKVWAKTIDEKLKHEKEVLHQLQKKGRSKAAPLLLKKIPIKIDGELDNQQLGNIEIDYIDYMEHYGSSAVGEFVCTIDSTCLASGWRNGRQ